MKFENREEYENSKIYFTKETCPFCENNILNEIILFETNFWYVNKAKYPYFNDYENHLLVIPKRHIEFTFELSEEELKDFLNIEKYMLNFYN
jgi:diadenosine tetraphosphate (Ap4A) HIT family hydrolase